MNSTLLCEKSQKINIGFNDMASNFNLDSKSPIIYTDSDMFFKNNKNIVVVGPDRIKTIKYLIEKRYVGWLVCDNANVFDKSFHEVNNVVTEISPVLIDFIIAHNIRKLIVSEIHSVNTALLFVSAINMGISVITSVRDVNWKKYIKGLFAGSCPSIIDFVLYTKEISTFEQKDRSRIKILEFNKIYA